MRTSRSQTTKIQQFTESADVAKVSTPHSSSADDSETDNELESEDAPVIDAGRFRFEFVI